MTSNIVPKSVKIINLEPSAEILKEVNHFLEQWNDSSACISQKTSGSTGKPKIIKIEKSKMLESAKMTNDYLNLKENDNALLCISPNYIGGKMMIVRAIERKLNLYITNVSGNPLLNNKFTFDFSAMVPYQVEKILEATPEKLNQIKKLIIGGAPLSDKTAEKLTDYPNEIFSTFGMTETISHIALRNVSKRSKIYEAIGNANFEIADENKLIINSPELGLEKLQTNDVVTLLNSKSFIWKGRADFVINSGGVKVHPEEIENKLKKHLNGVNFFISSLYDRQLGEKVILIIQQELSLKNNIFDDLDKYEKPKEIFYFNEFIFTDSGKINRLATLKKNKLV